MSFAWPLALLSLLVVPLIGGVYWWLLRRRRKQAVRYSSVTLEIDRDKRVANLTVRGPEQDEPATPEDILQTGDRFWPLRAFRELDDALLRLRISEPLIGTVLILFALVLGYADRVGRHEREISQLSMRDGFLIGLAQSLSLIPGVSRSGATMSAGLLLGLERPAAARFSFLLAVPAVVASGLFELKDVIAGDEHSTTPVGNVLVATLVAFLVGYAAIAWLLRYLAHHSVNLFVVYRVLLGSTVLVLVATGAIS